MKKKNTNRDEENRLIADLLRGAVVFHGFRLCGRTILISPAYVDGVVATETAVASENISTQNT